MADALQTREQSRDKMEAFIVAKRIRHRKAAEAKRIADVEAEKQKAARPKISVAVMTTDNRQHTVRRIKTASDRRRKTGSCPIT